MRVSEFELAPFRLEPIMRLTHGWSGDAARGQEGRSMHKKKWDDAVYFMAQDLCIIAL